MQNNYIGKSKINQHQLLGEREIIQSPLLEDNWIIRIIMIYKNVIPLDLKKGEHILWEESDYEAKALISEDKESLKEILRKVVIDMLMEEKVAVCIGLGLLDIMLEKLQAQFPINTFIRTIKPREGFVLRPGAVVFCMTNQEDFIKLIEYWGTLDGIQIIFPLDNCKENIINMVSTDNYIYKRHDFKVWNEIMSYAKVIITDTSIGDEFEIVYHKNDNLEMLSEINISRNIVYGGPKLRG